MNTKRSLMGWWEHAIPLLIALLALAMVILTPLWAWQFYQQPFLGVLLEPNNVVSKIGGHGWPARDGGVVWPDRLVMVNAHSVANVREVSEILSRNGFEPLQLSFIQYTQGIPLDELSTIQITPVHLSLGDLSSLFIIPYIVGITFLVTGIWAYRLRRELRASRAFLAFASAVSITATTFFDMNTTHHVVLLWSLSLFVAAGALSHLALVFPQQMPFVDRWPLTRLIPWAFTLILSIPTARVILFPSGPLAYIANWQSGYLFMVIALMLFFITLTLRVFRSDSVIVRQQSRVIVFGATLAFAPIMLFYLLPTALSSQPPEFRASLYFPLLVIFPLSVTYAILRYRLLDVDRLLGRVLTYALTTGIAMLFFYGLVAIISLVIRASIAPNDPLIIAGYLLLLVLGLTPMRDSIQKTIDRLFYRAPADYRRVLAEISSSLVVTPNLAQTLDLLEEKLQRAIAPEEFVIYLYDDDQQTYVPHGRTARDKPVLRADSPIVGLLSGTQSATWLPPNRALPPEVSQDARTFERIGCTVFVPLRYEGNLIGFLALGSHKSGEPYTSEDLDFLSTVAGQSSLALENARLFTNLRRTYEQTLEMKNLMDNIFASIATGVITTDLKQKITLFNQAAERILGVQVEEVLGKSLPEALPDLYPDLAIAATSAVNNGSVTLSSEVTPHSRTRGDLYLRMSCSPLRDAYLGTKGATIVFEDLTERRKLEAEQERIRQTFGRVVASRVRDRLLSDPSSLRLDGVKQKTTILFADLSGFTHFSEITETEVLFRVLNNFLSLATRVILEEEGTLDKFMGDAVMALWNAPDPQPDHALRAVRAAMAIIERTRQAHELLSESTHRLDFRVSVVTGDAMVGNVGTSELFNYTAIGDIVNLAQRLEVTAKPGQILIDQVTFKAVADQVIAKPLELIQVKGRTQPVQIYELLGIK